MKKIYLLAIPVAAVILAALLFFQSPSEVNITGKSSDVSLSQSQGFTLPDGPVHLHPHLEITVKGEKIPVPYNLGLGSSYSNHPFYDSSMRMTTMHTHDSTGTLHWEVMNHAPSLEELYLGNIFQIWGKKFDSSCIFEYCNGEDGNVKMFVNGVQNYDFEKYIVKDGDHIQIIYE